MAISNPKRLSILVYKGTKITYPENKNKTDNDIFGLKYIKNKAITERTKYDKNGVEGYIDKDLRSISPYFNGKRNTNYISPHLTSNIVFNLEKPSYNTSATPKNKRNNKSYNILSNQDYEEKEIGKKFILTDDEAVPNFGMKMKTNTYSSNLSRHETNNSFDMVKKIKSEYCTIDNIPTIPNKDKLVCEYCINDKIIKGVRKKKENEIENDSVYMTKFYESQKIEDDLKTFKHKIINDKIKKRENLSTLVSERIINGRDKEKSKLQKQNENETFIFHDRKKVNNDIIIAKEKFKKKELIQEGYLYKYIQTTKPEVNDYYNNCVEILSSIDQNDNKKSEKDKFNNYKEELSKQVELKKIKEERIKNAEHNLEIDNLIKKKQIEEKQEIEKLKKQNQIKKQFLKENEKILENKKNDEEMKNILKLKEVKNIDKIKKEIAFQEQNDVIQKIQLRKILINDLDKQINEKSKFIKNSQIRDNSDNLLIKSNAPCLICCAECSKQYPKSKLDRSIY